MPELGPTFVVAACIRRGEEVLLAQRYQPSSPQAHLKWELPGGKVRLEESPHEALAREIEEELGTTIQIVRLLPHVQSNVYETLHGKSHSIVIAFECTLQTSAPAPEPLDPAVCDVRWVQVRQVEPFKLLPGTLEFLSCLYRPDRASYGASHIYIRLERADPQGRRLDFWEIRMIDDLWSDSNLVERHGNLITRSTHYRLTRNVSRHEIPQRLVLRVRSLGRRGYRIVHSDDPFVASSA